MYTFASFTVWNDIVFCLIRTSGQSFSPTDVTRGGTFSPIFFNFIIFLIFIFAGTPNCWYWTRPPPPWTWWRTRRWRASYRVSSPPAPSSPSPTGSTPSSPVTGQSSPLDSLTELFWFSEFVWWRKGGLLRSELRGNWWPTAPLTFIVSPSRLDWIKTIYIIVRGRRYFQMSLNG